MPVRKLTKEKAVCNLKERVASNILVDWGFEYTGYKTTRVTCTCAVDGHTWETAYAKLMLGRGCPRCANNIKLTKTQVIAKLKSSIDLSIKIDYTELIYINALTANIKCSCSMCGYKWKAHYSSLMSGRGCKQCAGLLKHNKKEVVKALKNVVPNHIEIDYSFEYENSNARNIKCRCIKDGHEWKTSYTKLMHGHGCRKCSGSLKLTKDEAIENIKKSIPNNIKIDESFEYKNSTRCNINCRCTTHDYNWVSSHNRLTGGMGCPMCAPTWKITKKAAIISLKEKANPIFNIDYAGWKFIDIYTKNIKCVCINCGAISTKTHRQLCKGGACIACIASAKENAIAQVLTKEGIEYIREKTFPGMVYKNPLRLDFYLPLYSLAIEYNGTQHFQDFRAYHRLENQQTRDRIKTEWCLKNNITMIKVSDSPQRDADHITTGQLKRLVQTL